MSPIDYDLVCFGKYNDFDTNLQKLYHVLQVGWTHFMLPFRSDSLLLTPEETTLHSRQSDLGSHLP